MSNHKTILTQTFELIRKKYPELDANTLVFLADQAKRFFNEFESMGTNVNVNIMAAKLDGVIRSIREPSSNTMNRLSRSSTGEKLPSRSISRSTSDSELVYSFYYPKSQKIRVNVIRDEKNSPIPTRSNNTKSKNHHKTHLQRKENPKKNPSLIGSKTIEDLLKVANENVQTSSRKVERVIIIDRPKAKSPKPKSNHHEDKRSGLVKAPSKVNTTYQSLNTSTTINNNSNYYSSQPVLLTDTQWFVMTPYASNTTNFYQPYVYFSY